MSVPYVYSSLGGHPLARHFNQRVRHMEAALTEFAYCRPMRTAVPEYPQTRFVVKPVLVISTRSPGIPKSTGPVLSKPWQSPPCVNVRFPCTLYVQSQCLVS